MSASSIFSGVSTVLPASSALLAGVGAVLSRVGRVLPGGRMIPPGVNGVLSDVGAGLPGIGGLLVRGGFGLLDSRATGPNSQATTSCRAPHFGLSALAVVGSCAFCFSSSAEPMLNPLDVSPCAVRLDFDSFPASILPNPVTLTDLIFSTAGPGLGIVSLSNFPANGGLVQGNAISPQPSAILLGNIGYSTIQLALPRPAREVSVSWFDPNFAGNQVVLLGQNGDVLESVAVPLHPAGGCCASFVGARRLDADIYFVEFRVSSPADVYALDNLAIAYGVCCDAIDFNQNGVFPEDQDVVDYLDVLAGGSCPTCNDIDFNNNGVFPEDQDVIDFFNVLAGGTCP
jgi:hypothetical protein